jgi:hypothetical protein
MSPDPDDVDHRYSGPLRIVKIGETVGQPWAAMQQRCRRVSGESSITVRRSGHDPFEQTKHATHAGHAVERRDEMHFARAWIGKAGIDSAGKKRAHQALGTVHGAFFHYRSVSLMVLPAIRAPIVLGIFPSHFLSNDLRSAMCLARSLYGNRLKARATVLLLSGLPYSLS